MTFLESKKPTPRIFTSEFFIAEIVGERLG